MATGWIMIRRMLRAHFDLDRSIAVFDEGNIVGGAHSHRIEMSVPALPRRPQALPTSLYSRRIGGRAC